MVGSDRTLTLNVEMASSLASHGKARNRFVTPCNSFTSIAIVSDLVPWATDLMEQVGDALAAPRVASVAGEKSMWWSPEKGVRTNKAGQSGEERETSEVESVIPHYGSAPDHTRPEGVGRVGITLPGAKY